MGYTYQVECSEDKQWNFFLKGLYPNIYEKQTIYNREILSTCQENDDQVEVPRPIEHWLYFDTEQDMLSAIEKAAALGFTVYSSEKNSARGGQGGAGGLGLLSDSLQGKYAYRYRWRYLGFDRYRLGYPWWL